MRAAEAAKEAGVTLRQLQHWREIGILRPKGWVRKLAGRVSIPCSYSEKDVAIARAIGSISRRHRQIGFRRIVPALKLAMMQACRYLAVVFVNRRISRIKVLEDAAAAVEFATAVNGGVLLIEIP